MSCPYPLGTDCASTYHRALLQVPATFSLKASLNLHSEHLEVPESEHPKSNMWTMLDWGLKIITSSFLTLGKDISEVYFTLFPKAPHEDCILADHTTNLITLLILFPFCICLTSFRCQYFLGTMLK